MDYEAEDRDISAWVVTTTLNGTRFFLTDDLCATDRLVRARRWRDEFRAWRIAEAENDDVAWWQGEYEWRPMRVAEVKAFLARLEG